MTLSVPALFLSFTYLCLGHHSAFYMIALGWGGMRWLSITYHTVELTVHYVVRVMIPPPW